jgi:hypothetical protein
MSTRAIMLAVAVICVTSISNAQQNAVAINPAIDMPGYLRVAAEAAKYRETHRVSEKEFIRMSREPGTVILDARSKEKFDELHIKRALNLSFPDITIASLNNLLPDKNTRILIYCNNNFLGDEKAFPAKAVTASLNISTYIALYNYGYRNVYELGPLVEIKASKLDFESVTATEPNPSQPQIFLY